MLSIIFLALLGVGLVAAIVLYPILVYPKGVNKNVPFVNANANYVLSPIAQNHLAGISFDRNSHQLKIRKKETTNSAVITVIYKKDNKVGFDVYNLDFSNGNVATLDLDASVTSYYVVLEKVNGQSVKDTYKSSNGLRGAIIYSLIVSLILVGAFVVYTIYCSAFLNNYYPGYFKMYFLAAIPLAIVPVIIGLHIVMDKVVLKGGK